MKKYLLLLFLFPLFVGATETDWIYPTSNTADCGGTAWTSPANAYSDNTTYATGVDVHTRSLFTAFGLHLVVPSDVESIDGFEVRVKGNLTGGDGSTSIRTYASKDACATLLGEVVVNSGGAWTGTDAVQLGGSSSYLWDTTWTYADLSSVGFRIGTATGGDYGTFSMDSVAIKVHYTGGTPIGGGGGTVSTTTVNVTFPYTHEEWLFVSSILIFFISLMTWRYIFRPLKEIGDE